MSKKEDAASGHPDPYTVEKWMTRDPETVSPDLTARTAFLRMRIEGYRHLIVEENGNLVGIVTDRDLRRPNITSAPDGWNGSYDLDSDYTVRDVMTADPITANPDDRLEVALALFREHKVGALPVVDDVGDAIGILTTSDALRAFEAVMKSAGRALRRPRRGKKTSSPAG